MDCSSICDLLENVTIAGLMEKNVEGLPLYSFRIN